MSTDTAQPNPGEQLRARRKQMDLSLQDVQKRLKISVQRLENLENVVFENDTLGIYACGHLRSYCKLLNLSADTLLEELESLGFTIERHDKITQPPEPTPTKPKRKFERRWWVVVVAGICWAAAAIWHQINLSQNKPGTVTNKPTEEPTPITADDVPFYLDNPTDPSQGGLTP